MAEQNWANLGGILFDVNENGDSLRLYVRSKGGVTYGMNSGDYTPYYNNWTHLTGVYNGASLKVYINGEFLNETSAPAGEIGIGSESLIGIYTDKTTNQFSGCLDGFNIFKYSFSIEEIKAQYERRKYSLYEPIISYGDLDGDGLNDYIEICDLSSNPLNTDTDLDGMPDGWEYFNGLNLTLGTDNMSDADNDDLENYYEYFYGTDVNNPDSDGDGYTDGEEVYVYGTNPLDPSSVPDTERPPPLEEPPIIIIIIIIIIIGAVSAAAGFYVIKTKQKKQKVDKLERGPQKESETESFSAQEAIRKRERLLTTEFQEKTESVAKESKLTPIPTPVKKAEPVKRDLKPTKRVEPKKAIMKKKVATIPPVPIDLSKDEEMELAKTESEVGVEKNQFTCIVHRGDIHGNIYLCQQCQTFYCDRCAKVLKLKGDKCWSCGNEIAIVITEKDKLELLEKKSEEILDDLLKEMPIIKNYIESNKRISEFPELKEFILTILTPEDLDKIDLLELSIEEKKQFIQDIVSYNVEDRERLIDEMLEAK